MCITLFQQTISHPVQLRFAPRSPGIAIDERRAPSLSVQGKKRIALRKLASRASPSTLTRLRPSAHLRHSPITPCTAKVLPCETFQLRAREHPRVMPLRRGRIVLLNHCIKVQPHFTIRSLRTPISFSCTMYNLLLSVQVPFRLPSLSYHMLDNPSTFQPFATETFFLSQAAAGLHLRSSSSTLTILTQSHRKDLTTSID